MPSISEITARLTLNAKDFTARFDGAIDQAVTRARAGGTQVGRAFADTASGGLRSFAADVPVLGGALTGLSGVALGAAAGIGAITVAAGFAIANTEEYTQATRGLEAVLKATGNQTGFTTGQLKDFAEAQESALAISAESIIGAEKVLSSFSGVAGSTFERAILGAADLAAVYGGDLASNTEKLGVVLQNLAQGNVDGLSRAFKFLGTTTLDSIAALAKSGDTAGAQVALLDALEKKVGGAGAAAGQGVAGAFFRLTDALGDTSRALGEQSGLYAGTVSWLDKAAAEADAFADSIKELNGLELTGEVFRVLGGGKIREATTKRDGSIKFGNDPLADLDTFTGNIAAKRAADAAKAEGDKARAAEQAAEAAADAVKRAAADRAKALAAEAAAQKAADAAREARQRAFEAIKQEGWAADLQALDKLTAANDDFFADWLANSRKTQTEAAQVAEKLQDDLTKKQEADFRYLSDSFFEIFSGRSGNIWGKFKELGARTLSELASQFVLGGKIDIGGTSAGGLVNSIAGLVSGSKGGGGISSLLGAGGSAAGIAGLIGGAGLTAAPIGAAAAAAAGVPLLAGTGGAVAAGTGLIGGLGAAGAALAAAAPWLAAAAGVIALGVAVFGNKTPEAFQEVTGSGLGMLGGVKGGDKAESRAGAASLGEAGFGNLQQLAAALGGGLDANARLGALGVYDKQFSFDTTPGAGNNRQLFGTQDAAIEAFTRSAISQGVLTGVDASVAKLLSSGDLKTQTAKAQLLASALKGFNDAADPTGGAVKALTEQFEQLRAVMAEAGSSAEDVARASADYDKKLQAIRESSGTATTTLKAFLDDLGFGSSSPLAIGDQAAAAREAYGRATAGIGGAGFDQSAFVAAGQRLLDIEGQLNGRTQDFFAVFNQVQADTNRAIGAINNAAGITGDNPFARKTADATAATADNTSMMAQLLQSLPAQLAALMNSPGGGFIGGDARGFAVAA